MGRKKGSSNKDSFGSDKYLRSAILNLRVSPELLNEIDIARANYKSTSQFVIDAICRQLLTGYRGNQKIDPDHIHKMS